MQSGWKSVGLENLSKFNREYNNIAQIKIGTGENENKEGGDDDDQSDSTEVASVNHYEYDDHDDWNDDKATWSVIVACMPWFVPETYEILLQNHQFRKYHLKFYHRIYILLTDSSSW
jgi:hypothetical protein